MPIDFGNADTLTRAQRLFDNPLGWGSRVIQMMSDAFGNENPFNSAALLDAGGADGVPVIAADGSLESLIADATTNNRGLVRSGDVADIPSIDALFAAVAALVDVFNLNVRSVPFAQAGRAGGRPVIRYQTSNQSSILLISTKGQDDPISVDRLSNSVVLTAQLENDDATNIWLSPPASTVERAPDGTILANNLRELDFAPIPGNPRSAGPVSGIYLLNEAQLNAFSFSWGVLFKNWGSQGNDGVLDTNPDQSFEFNNHMRTRGLDADLLVVFKAGATNIYHRSSSPSNISSALLSRSNNSRQGRSGFVLEILL